jgi:hypothetical protein
MRISVIDFIIWFSFWLISSDKQAQLEKIRDRLRQQMEQKISDEDSRIKAAVDEKDAQKASEEAEKAAKREQMLRSIKEHREDQVAF